MPGLRAVPSQANFVLVLFEGELTAETAYKGLMDAGYIVRWLPGQGLPHGLRITIGTEDEMRGVPRRCASWSSGRLMLPFARVTIIGLGLIGSSIARAVRAADADACASPAMTPIPRCARPRDRLELCDDVTDTPGAAVIDADLVILCVPVGAMGAAAAEIAADLPADAIVSDVGIVQGERASRRCRAALPGATIVPAHPVAGTERSGPEAGFATLFHGRWCILTPPEGADPVAVERVARILAAAGRARSRSMAPDASRPRARGHQPSAASDRLYDRRHRVATWRK